jgi:RNA polymerase sigma factor (TIGR02999 family)
MRPPAPGFCWEFTVEPGRVPAVVRVGIDRLELICHCRHHREPVRDPSGNRTASPPAARRASRSFCPWSTTSCGNWRARLAQLAPGQTLGPTALVHEVYVRLAGKEQDFDGARHFFFAAARAMHDLVVERARQKASFKRGGDRKRLDLDKLVIAHESPPEEIVALAEALGELEQLDARKHRLVLLRFFAGCTNEQAANAMQLSSSTAAREWRYARAWLHQRLSSPVARP